MPSLPFEKLIVYQMSENLADQVWEIVTRWKPFVQNTVGGQLVRSADSIGANIAEGTGRGSYKENRRFIRISRGSFYETRHWLRRAFKRKLLSKADIDSLKPLVEAFAPKLNAYLKSIGKTKSRKSTDQ
jgi:four helix bundle protein